MGTPCVRDSPTAQLAWSLAAAVVRRADRQQPADATLRTILRSQRWLEPPVAAAVSRMVFAYYRWLGWTRGERKLETRLRLAGQLAKTYLSSPMSFARVELRTKAIPAWVLGQMDVTDAWLHALQSEPALWLRAKRGTGAALARELESAIPGPLPDAIRYEGDADLFQSAAFRAGEFEIQDLASQAVGFLCNPQPGELWWDACAGEGGKTLHLSDLMHNRGLIWASDRAAWRLARLRRRAARARVFNYRCAPWDGRARLPMQTKFDGVLVDAPCSGLGTWQRNPHARWTTTPADVTELAEVQKGLLANAAKAVKPGGKLCYSVCTLTRTETAGVVEHFNLTQPAFAPAALPGVGVSKALGRAEENAAQCTLLSEYFGGNGMFVASWRKHG